MPSIYELLQAPSRAEWFGKITSFLQLADFPVASWHKTSIPRFFAETHAAMLADQGSLIRKIASSGFLRLAAAVGDDFLDLVAHETWDEDREPAVLTIGECYLTDVGSVGPTTIQPRTVWASDGGENRYIVTGFPDGSNVVPLDGSIRVTVEAESAGSSWNVGNNAIDSLITSLPGIEISNPPGITGTWITQQGSDPESNDSLIERCLDKWDTIGTGATDGAYRYHARTGFPEVSRTPKVYTEGGGNVRIVIAGSSGPVSPATHAAVSAKIDEKRPLAVPDVLVKNAVTRSQAVNAVLFIPKGVDAATVIAEARANVDAFARSLDIGAFVSRDQIGRALCTPRDVKDITLTEPAEDMQLTTEEIFVPTFTLTTSPAP